MRDLTPAPPPCVLAPARCSAPASFVFLAVDAEGVAGDRIVNTAGERVGSCEEHTGEVMARLAGLPGAPPRIRAVPLFPVVPSAS